MVKPAFDKVVNIMTKEENGGKGKYCGKRRKCWLPAFSPFPTMFSYTLFSLVRRCVEG